MKTIRTAMTVVVALALGCSSSEGGDGTGDDGLDPHGDPNGPGVDPEDVPASALDVTGSYELTSEFDMVGGLPGTGGAVVNAFLDMTDDPNDPATWVIDQVLGQLDDSGLEGTAKDLVQSGRVFLDPLVNELILSLAPDVVTTLVEVGDRFGQVARGFGTVSVLEVSASGATHTLEAVTFRVDGQRYTFAMDELGLVAAPVGDVAFDFASDKTVLIGDHGVPLSYGTMLLVAMDQIIIPSVDPFASGLGEMLAGLIDCAAIGDAMSEEIGWLSSGAYEGFCESGLDYAAGYLRQQIASLDDAAMTLDISGAAKGKDTNGDRKIDTFQAGRWEGKVRYPGFESTLSAEKNEFRGQRR